MLTNQPRSDEETSSNSDERHRHSTDDCRPPRPPTYLRDDAVELKSHRGNWHEATILGVVENSGKTGYNVRLADLREIHVPADILRRPQNQGAMDKDSSDQDMAYRTSATVTKNEEKGSDDSKLWEDESDESTLTLGEGCWEHKIINCRECDAETTRQELDDGHNMTNPNAWIVKGRKVHYIGSKIKVLGEDGEGLRTGILTGKPKGNGKVQWRQDKSGRIWNTHCDDLQTVEMTRFSSGDKVKVVEEFKSDDRSKTSLIVGLEGVIRDINEDDHAQVKFDGITRNNWIKKKNFHKLEKMVVAPEYDSSSDVSSESEQAVTDEKQDRSSKDDDSKERSDEEHQKAPKATSSPSSEKRSFSWRLDSADKSSNEQIRKLLEIQVVAPKESSLDPSSEEQEVTPAEERRRAWSSTPWDIKRQKVEEYEARLGKFGFVESSRQIVLPSNDESDDEKDINDIRSGEVMLNTLLMGDRVKSRKYGHRGYVTALDAGGKLTIMFYTGPFRGKEIGLLLAYDFEKVPIRTRKSAIPQSVKVEYLKSFKFNASTASVKLQTNKS